jgi:uncharacterized protein (AIM24 family)
MADFDIVHGEGSNWAQITLKDETVVIERGAMSHMRGDLKMKGRLPGPLRLLRAVLSGEEAFRPTISGTGMLYLESSFGGFYIMDLPGTENWVVESGAFWCSEARLTQTFHRERFTTSFWTGNGLLDFKTKVVGQGRVMICSPGPVEEIILGKDSPHGSQLIADGPIVLARTESISYTVRLPSLLPWRRAVTGESMLRVYRGEGRMLVCATPFWRYKIMQGRDDKDELNLLT